jgi:hypothetical protein
VAFPVSFSVAANTVEETKSNIRAIETILILHRVFILFTIIHL